MIAFTLPILVVPKGRPRVTRSGHAFTPQASRDFEEEFTLRARPHCPAPLEGALEVRMTFGIPGKGHTPGTPHDIKRGDVDNFAKAVLDALNGIAYNDDSQVFDLRAVKMWAATPSIHVEISEVVF